MGTSPQENLAREFWQLTEEMTKKLLNDSYEERLNRVEGYAYISTVLLLCLNEYRDTFDVGSVKEKYIDYLFFEYFALPENKGVDQADLAEMGKSLFMNRTILYQEELRGWYLKPSNPELPYRSCYLLFFAPLTSGANLSHYMDVIRPLVEVYHESLQHILGFLMEGIEHIVQNYKQ